MSTSVDEGTYRGLDPIDRHIAQQCIQAMEATQRQLTQLLNKIDELEGRVEQLEDHKESSF